MSYRRAGSEAETWATLPGISFGSMPLKKSPRKICGIGIRNNRIEGNRFLNQRCALAPDLESILRAPMSKILFQQHRSLADIPTPTDDSVTRLDYFPILDYIPITLPIEGRSREASFEWGRDGARCLGTQHKHREAGGPRPPALGPAAFNGCTGAARAGRKPGAKVREERAARPQEARAPGQKPP